MRIYVNLAFISYIWCSAPDCVYASVWEFFLNSASDETTLLFYEFEIFYFHFTILDTALEFEAGLTKQRRSLAIAQD